MKVKSAEDIIVHTTFGSVIYSSQWPLAILQWGDCGDMVEQNKYNTHEYYHAYSSSKVGSLPVTTCLISSVSAEYLSQKLPAYRRR